MPWTITDPMLERARLVAAHLEGVYSVAELAARFGVSRQTAYKWVERYRDGGVDALADRSHAPPRAGPPDAAGGRGAILDCRAPTRRGGRASSCSTSPSGTPTCAPRPEYGRAPSSTATG